MDKILRFDNSYKEILWKGSIAILVTLGAGLLFGKENMMIAFVLVLGANALAMQNLRIKTVNKTFRLIVVDTLLVGLSFIASLNDIGAIPINLVTLFAIIYISVSPYNQMTYKTFMMLFVFCQYTTIAWIDLPKRLLMVAAVVSIVVLTSYLEQRRYKALLPPQVSKGFHLLREQLIQMMEGKLDEGINVKIIEQMNALAYVIYHSRYRRYFTTYVGKVHFQFYLNMSYFNVLLEQIYRQMQKGMFSKEQLLALKRLFDEMEAYFERKISREALVGVLDKYLERYTLSTGGSEDVYQVIEAFRKNFVALKQLPYEKKDAVYDDWGRSDLSRMQYKIRHQLKPKSMSFNFALRMAIVLSILLFLASRLGFYKFIWAIIPVMSITQPYYEDTKKRGKERVKSNILASLVLALIIDVLQVRWMAFALLVIAFYLIYAYKDYYHMSIFLTIISMCVASVSKGIRALVFYRIIYVILGATIVVLTSKLLPYKLEDGIHELIAETERLNKVLEKESLLSLEGKANLNRIREAIIYSAVLSQKLYIKNKQYQSERVDRLIRTNIEFVIRIGYCMLRDE